MTARARAIEWWRRCQTDPEKRDFRRIGIVAFGVVGASVILAKVTQETAVGGYVRAFAITMFGLATIALLAVVLLMGEQMVDAMDETDPLRVRHGGAYGPRVKRFFRDLRSASRAWITSRPAKVAALRHELTRDSLARLAAASGAALAGIPPADAAPPEGAGRLARVKSEPPPPPEQEPDDGRAGRYARAVSGGTPCGGLASHGGDSTIVAIRPAGGGATADQGQIKADASAHSALGTRRPHEQRRRSINALTPAAPTRPLPCRR